MMSTLFVILLYSSGMPVFYIIAAFFYALTYFTNKMLIIKFYRTSQTLTRTIPKTAINILKLALILHIACGCFMMTNPMPL